MAPTSASVRRLADSEVGMFARCSMAFLAVVLLIGAPVLARGAPLRAPTAHVDVTSLPPLGTRKPVKFDSARAVNAYLSTINGAARAKSDAYFEGGYWLLLVDTLYALGVAAILLWG